MNSIVITEIKASILRNRLLDRLARRTDIVAPDKLAPGLARRIPRFLVAGLDDRRAPGSGGWPVFTGGRYAKLCFSPSLSDLEDDEVASRIYRLPTTEANYVDYVAGTTGIGPGQANELARIFRFDPAELYHLCRQMQAERPAAWRLLLSNEFALARQLWPDLGDPHPRMQFRHRLVDAFRILAEFERAGLVMRHLARARSIVDRPKLLEALQHPAPLSLWFKPDELIELYRWFEYASFSSPALTDLMLERDEDGIRALPKGYAPWALAQGDAIGASADYHDDPQVRAAMIRVFAKPELPYVERRKVMLRNDEVLRWYGMTSEVLPIITLDDARARFPTGRTRKVPGVKVHGHIGLHSREVLALLGSAMRRRADPAMEQKVANAPEKYLRNSRLTGHSPTLEANVKLGLKMALIYLPPADRLGGAGRFDPCAWKNMRRDAALWRAILDPHHHGRVLLRRHPAAAQLIVTIRAMRRAYGGVFAQVRWSPEVERAICDMAVGLSPISVDPYIAFAIYSLDKNPALKMQLDRQNARKRFGS